MLEELIRRVDVLGKEYFGSRSDRRIVRALQSQLESIERDGSELCVRKQAGDMLFLLCELARNHGWDVSRLLEERVDVLERRRQERFYYEAHVTLEPVFGERRERLAEIAKIYGFRPAELLMQKRKEDTPERSAKDAFCTGRGIARSDLRDRMLGFVDALERADFTVWRYKIEETIEDSRYDDSRRPLQRDKLPDRERDPRSPADGAPSGRAT